MRQTVIRTRWLDRDVPAIGDFHADGSFKDNARRGSAKLLTALLKFEGRQHARRKGPVRPRTWSARKVARSEIDHIQRTAAPLLGIEYDDLIARRGNLELRDKRNLVMYLARHLTLASYPTIGKCFGGRDHTTVLSCINRVERQIVADVEFALHVRTIAEILNPSQEALVA